MFKKLVKTLYAAPALLVAAGTAFAVVPVSTTTPTTSTGTIEVLTDLSTTVIFLYNVSFWLGGFIILVSVLGGFGLMAWKAWSGDDEAAKVAQTWFPKVLLAGFAGVLMIMAPTIFNFVSSTLGGSNTAFEFDVNSTNFRTR